MRPSSGGPAFALRLISFLVPTIAGCLVALAIFNTGRPFDDRGDYLLWLSGAAAVALVVSALTSSVVARVGPIARLRKRSSEFDVEVDSRFRERLRSGNTKTLIRTGHIDLTADEQMQQVVALLDRLSNHDRLTRGHSERVRAYSTLIGEELGLSEGSSETLSWSALLHDVGKLDVAAEILSSPDRPTEEEWAEIRTHPASGRPYLEPLEPWLGEEVYHAAEGHHERWDGSGYPRGLAGTDIPLFGRIVSVADAFDVMTSTRSYKKPFTIEEARRRLEDGSGSQFDPKIIDAFLRIGEPRLRAVRGFAAVAAGASAMGLSAIVATGAQVVAAATTVVGTALVTEPPPRADPPAAVAFEETTTTSPTTTTTTTAAPTTTTAPPTTAPTTTTTSSTTTTSIVTVNEATVRIVTMQYSIGSIRQDGQTVTVDGDRLDVFVDGAFDQSIPMTGRRQVTVSLNVSDLAPGVHTVRFDLFDGTELVSTDGARFAV